MLSFRLAYIFCYNLLQFCGHSWILANTIARFLMFGKDALADTFYSVGFVMSLCQLLSILELFHIADGIEKARLLPRFFQVVEKNVLLMVVIVLEELQSKPVVCVQLFLWNVLDLLRYPHELLCVLDQPSVAMLWSRYSLWIPVYIISAASEGATVYRAADSAPPAASHVISVPAVLRFYLLVLPLGASVTVWQLLKERRHHLDKWNKRKKRK
ncbi:very-long-chain (3R)-3-hydroxyacyl-CoA dehydratase 4 isoform X2 [Cololabis saira]|uniref:very-long-chain (3R)-3-hydroxyacyl-CoA dehydratase 4 isoform X2 n=1 Tax=Cololabis saira TaxID=129043 RepID=UPI002AD2C50D|nr:very-long-chain (3R)-3-hydroxyacyl-CoA dehydratase 4 isoform X2 [Cololabis saira]